MHTLDAETFLGVEDAEILMRIYIYSYIYILDAVILMHVLDVVSSGIC